MVLNVTLQGRKGTQLFHLHGSWSATILAQQITRR